MNELRIMVCLQAIYCLITISSYETAVSSVFVYMGDIMLSVYRHLLEGGVHLTLLSVARTRTTTV